MGRICEVPQSERPREKAVRYGIGTLSSRELLAVIIGAGTKGQSALETADLLLRRAEGVKGLPKLMLGDLEEVRGIRRARALQLQACFELARRITAEEVMAQPAIDGPEDLLNWLKTQIGLSTQEEMLAVYLSSSSHVIAFRTLFRGTMKESTVSAYEIIRGALSCHANRILLVHNHPGGTLQVSSADIAFTRKAAAACRLLDILLIDHVIVTDSRMLSLRAQGLLKD